MNREEIQLLKMKLVEYRDITLELISHVEQEEFEILEEKLNKRQEIINSLQSIKYTKEVFKEICKILNLIPLEQRLVLLMKGKKGNISKEINNLGESKNATRSYGKSINPKSIFLSEKR